MSKSILKELPQLVEAGIISEETSNDIQKFYEQRSGAGTNRMVLVFAILGALLTGLGIILIIAHNWDDLTKPAKTVFSFLPLLLGQGVALYALIKKSDVKAWTEGAATFLAISIGASISMVAQTYNISGNLSEFILTWVLLALPLVYLMRSSLVSLLYIIGVTWYACDTNYWWYSHGHTYLHWLLIFGIAPHYIMLFYKNVEGNFFKIHNWVLAICFIILLGTVSETHDYIFVSYISLYGIYSLIGNSYPFIQSRRINNPFLLLGSAGTVILLISLSFRWFWDDLNSTYRYSNPGHGPVFTFSNPEFTLSIIVSLIALLLFIRKTLRKTLIGIDPLESVFLFFIVIFLMGTSGTFGAVVFDNILVFLLGLYYIQKGARLDHLGILNYGLLILSALIVSRYFDSDMSFAVRGGLFVMAGLGFFFANYSLLKKRKSSASLNE